MATDSVAKEKSNDAAAVREPLSTERILAAAMELVDREGLEALSMRRLGSELGVKGMSLYNHIPNKSALLFSLINRMFAEITLTDVDATLWKDQVRSIMHSFREVGLAHPNIFLLYASRSWDAVRINRRDADLLLLRRSGFSQSEAAYGIRALSSYVLGFVAREIERLSPAEADGERPELFDLPASAARQLSPQESDEAFEFGLELILTGMEARLTTAS